MSPLLIKALAALAVIAVAFGAGWRVKGAFVAERDLAITEAKQSFIESHRQSEAVFGRILQDKMDTLKANERIINNEIVKVVDRPVYLNQCLDADGLKLIEQARKGVDETAINTGK